MAVQEIDLGNVQGPKGDPGPQGPQGKQGPEGPQGPPGEFNMEAGLTFSEASTRTNINSGESLKTILGKIKKFFTDLKPHAFTDPVNNLTGTDPRFPLAAPQGKALDQKIAQLNSALAGKVTNENVETIVCGGTISGLTFSNGICTYDISKDIPDGYKLDNIVAILSGARTVVLNSAQISSDTTVTLSVQKLDGTGGYTGTDAGLIRYITLCKKKS